MESVDVQSSLAPCPSFYQIQDPQLRERWLHAPTHASFENESVGFEKNKDSQAPHHSTIIGHVCSTLSEDSLHYQPQDQQQRRQDPGSGSGQHPGSLNATPPCCLSSYDGELTSLAADCSDPSSSCPHHHQTMIKVESVGSSRSPGLAPAQ